MNTYFLPTISEILASEGQENDLSFFDAKLAGENNRHRCPGSRGASRLKAEQEWYGAIATLNQMLDRQKSGQKTNADRVNSRSTIPNSCQGLVLSGPSSVLTDPEGANGFANWIFTSIPDNDAALWSFRARQTLALLPAAQVQTSAPAAAPALALAIGDPLANEQFCLVLTASFSLVMVLGENSAGIPAFLFSFDPQVVAKAWEVLRRRVTESDSLLANSDGGFNLPVSQLTNNSSKLDALFEQFSPVAPNYKTVMQFSRLLLQNLPLGKEESSRVKDERADDGLNQRNQKLSAADINCKSPIPHATKEVELLQAIAHEVRTPLATIRTLTRLLLKRPKLDPVVVKRLEMIDAECTAQIDRFGLIFRAVELEMSQAKNSGVQLTAMSLGEVLQNSIPRWQKQAAVRNHTLEVIVPKKLPAVVSDPTMLDQVLTNLIEDFTRTLPSGSRIQVEVTLAGDQLKLQLESTHLPEGNGASTFAAKANAPLRSIGPLLMVQPETGSLSLNLSVTKNLFRAAGGKLVIRQRPEKGEVMTVFLPLQ
ncbi:HAMP domain-containing histidine kinase [Microcoleus vaginatus GB1-A2]|uniref:HAMP domain-containing histidine kinase n=1 Tax=Microcoleus vaginatus TaxID=119532 RepID=UPI001689DEA5|nr:HAMP domain-containing histidine kinase [Microcoleus sp. FACHB-61]